MTEKYTPEKVAELVDHLRNKHAFFEKFSPDTENETMILLRSSALALAAVSAERDEAWRVASEQTMINDDKREELIEEAAKALTGLTDAEWEIATAEGTDHLTGYFEAAARCLAVFEKAHAPTDDEREALAQLIFERSHTPDDPLNLWDGDINKLVGAILAAGFRRSEVPEPQANVSDPEKTYIPGEQMSVSGTQGEPSDAPLNAERENAAAGYARRNIGGMQPVVTIGERVHDAFVSGAEWERDHMSHLPQGEPTDIDALIAEALAGWEKAERQGIHPWKRGRALRDALRASMSTPVDPDNQG